jgi:hypothetical protein
MPWLAVFKSAIRNPKSAIRKVVRDGTHSRR